MYLYYPLLTARACHALACCCRNGCCRWQQTSQSLCEFSEREQASAVPCRAAPRMTSTAYIYSYLACGGRVLHALQVPWEAMALQVRARHLHQPRRARVLHPAGATERAAQRRAACRLAPPLAKASAHGVSERACERASSHGAALRAPSLRSAVLPLAPFGTISSVGASRMAGMERVQAGRGGACSGAWRRKHARGLQVHACAACPSAERRCLPPHDHVMHACMHACRDLTPA